MNIITKNRDHLSGASRKKSAGQLKTPHLLLEWTESSWDTAVFGFPVLQIMKVEIRDSAADIDFQTFESVRDRVGAGLVSCRLSYECLRESMLLEDHGFRFIEMLYQPELGDLQNRVDLDETGLDTVIAEEGEVPAILDIAGSAFTNERFHSDPRLDSTLGDERYCNWVQNSINHPTQRLYMVRDGMRVVAFFVIEMMPDKTCYWHLNAVAPGVQGQGYGKRAWIAMLRLAREQGAKKVRTCIIARNYKVLNLYAQLGFRFPPPLMTLHWVRDPLL